MPDVDRAVRLLTHACTTYFHNQNESYKKSVINEFYNLPDVNKPSEMRGKSYSQLVQYFNRLYQDVVDAISETFECDVDLLKEDSNNNKIGADLIATIRYDEIKKDEKIELKFGKETLRAIGIATFDKIFVVDYDTGFFTEIFTDVKNNQRKFALDNPGEVDLLISNLEKQLSPIIEKSNELADSGHLRINSNEMALQLSGTGSIDSEDEASVPTKLFVGWNSINVSEKLDLSGDWRIIEISPSKDKGARINFIASNGKVETKFLLHWKNDMVFDGYKYPAKTGINSYCFNVWAWRIK